MSTRALPWYRTYTCLHRDADYDAMSMAQHGVYRDLLDHVGEQTERGTFRVDNLQLLANRVAHGDVNLLQSVIEYCETQWLGEDGVPHIVTDGKYGRFTTYAKHQRPPSQESEAVRERVMKHRETRNDDVTVTKQLRNAVKRDCNALVEGEEDRDIDAAAVVSIPSRAVAREAPAPSPDDEPRSTSSKTVCDTLRISASDPAAEVVSAAVHHRGDLDHRYEAVKCREHYPDWDRKTPGARARLYAKWVDRAFDPAQQQQQQNGHQRTRAPTGITETPISHLPPERLAWAEQFNEDAKRRRD